ncbi:alpha/beta hydrolase [Ramlibacter sp. AN1015]|uniref:alpha/beta fold hydrolase n=1 Tax=Ramlibacter sp. AN1015 TaxID=3133428 RepID=UPI0030BF1129
MQQQQEGFTSTRYGRIHYVEQGAGEPLILMHSNGCSHHEFDAALPLLAQKYRCIAWDMPGHGDSEPGPNRHLSVLDYVDAVVAFMDSLGIQKAHIGGASIGGMIALAAGAITPDRALSVAIIEAPLRSEREWAAQWARTERMFAFLQQGEAEVAPRLRKLTPELLERWNIDRLKAGSWRMMDVMWALRQFDARAHLQRMHAPACVVIGDKGPVFGSKSAYAELLPRAPLKVLTDCGHFPMIDDPQAFCAALHEAICEARAAAG